MSHDSRVLAQQASAWNFVDANGPQHPTRVGGQATRVAVKRLLEACEGRAPMDG